ncbi:peptidase S28 [Hypoxylon sp. FL0543]|nr:peptidase S28 [Hypoxylon sp. FL0543]
MVAMTAVAYYVFSFLICLEAVMGLTPSAPYPPPDEDSGDLLVALSDPNQPETGTAYFEQYIDHNNLELGKFRQTYWYNATFWKGPGSPIVLFTPGESAGIDYLSFLTDQSIAGLIAKKVGGAVLMVEHRYWGNSTPYEALSTKNLQYLNVDQAVSDFVHFAQTAQLPFDTSGSSNAREAPWIWTGGSYSGALGAWIESLSPGTFWATHSSSGPVEAIYNYWEYFYAIQQGMPKNCSKDFTAIINYVDEVFTHSSPKEQARLKQLFGLQELAHVEDVAAAISYPIYAWQKIQFVSGYSQFYQMCDAIEGFFPNSTATFNGTSSCGIGLKRALRNYAKWYKTQYLPGYCASYLYEDWQSELNVQCFDTFNKSSPVYTDQTVNNSFDRTWVWMTCNDPLFYYQTGAPANRPTVFSRLANAQYYQRQCDLFFPKEGSYTYGSASGKTARTFNAHTKGWNLPKHLDKTSRLLFVNGEFDPWRSASVASKFRPDGPLISTADVPSIIIPGSRHCNDLRVYNAVNPDIAKAQVDIVAQIAKWTKEFYT